MAASSRTRRWSSGVGPFLRSRTILPRGPPSRRTVRSVGARHHLEENHLESISVEYGRSGLRRGGGNGSIERREVETGRQKVSEIMRELHFFALSAEIRSRHVEGVLFGSAHFAGLKAGFFHPLALLRSKANFG